MPSSVRDQYTFQRRWRDVYDFPGSEEDADSEDDDSEDADSENAGSENAGSDEDANPGQDNRDPSSSDEESIMATPGASQAVRPAGNTSTHQPGQASAAPARSSQHTVGQPAVDPLQRRRPAARAITGVLQVDLHQIPANVRSQFRTVLSENDQDNAPVAIGRARGRGNEPAGSGAESSDDSSFEPPARAPRRRHARRRSASPEDDIRISNGNLVVAGEKELSTGLDRFVKQAPEIVRRAQRWVSEHRPALERFSEVEALLPRLPLDATWTAKDRSNVDRLWRNAAQRERLLNVAKQKELLTLYKACLRMMRCLPEDVIGCQFDLRYDMTQNRVSTAKHQSLFWSSHFCKALTALLVHPTWDGVPATLAVAIQYTIIVDTKDSGIWDTAVPGCADSFLTRLLDRKRQQPNTNAARLRRELHDEVSATQRNQFNRQTETPVSQWDVLFQTIEQLARKVSKTPAKPRQHPSHPFLAHRHHLDMLTRALDSMPHMGAPRFLPADVYHRIINGRRAAGNYPQKKDFRQLREYAIVCERERAAYKEVLKRQGAQSDAVVPDTQTSEVPQTQPEAGGTASRGEKRSHSEPPQLSSASQPPGKRPRVGLAPKPSRPANGPTPGGNESAEQRSLRVAGSPKGASPARPSRGVAPSQGGTAPSDPAEPVIDGLTTSLYI